MKFLIFIPPKDFRDESLSLVKLFFDKWGIRYDITSYTSNECIGTHGAAVRPDIHTSKVNSNYYDGIVLIDGKGIEDYKLFDYRPLLDIMYIFNESHKQIISISNSIKIPARANIVRGKKISTDMSDPESRRLILLFHGELSDNAYEMAGNLISIRNGTDIEETMPQILEHIGAT
ncbi:MAG: DJ-1/PfpI family protein [Candidatus Micrarchaeaceae archaeon]